MTQLAGDFDDSNRLCLCCSSINSDGSKDSDDSSDIAHCPTSDPESTNTPADTKGTAMFDEQCLQGLLALFAPLGLPDDDSEDSSDFAFAAPSDDSALHRHCR